MRFRCYSTRHTPLITIPLPSLVCPSSRCSCTSFFSPTFFLIFFFPLSIFFFFFFFLIIRPPPRSPLFPYPTLFRSRPVSLVRAEQDQEFTDEAVEHRQAERRERGKQKESG